MARRASGSHASSGACSLAYATIFPTRSDLEITVECNPTSLDLERARALKDAGVDRLSIGTQSLRAEQLKFLGRLHDPDGAMRAIEAALASGIARVSTDLIFGLPDQTTEDASAQADALAATGLRHLSCYQLTIEPGTQFGERRKRGLLPMADEGVVADAFLAVEATLEARGLRHYEISNYAFPGEEARHNLAYWRGDEYLGLGCAAFGFARDEKRKGHGLRWRNTLEPKRYVEATRTMKDDPLGDGDGVSMFSEELDGTALLRERIMLGLRLATGVDLARASADPRARPVDARAPARHRPPRRTRTHHARRGVPPHPARCVALHRRHRLTPVLTSSGDLRAGYLRLVSARLPLGAGAVDGG